MANRKNQTRRPARTYFEQISVDAVQALTPKGTSVKRRPAQPTSGARPVRKATQRGVATPVRLVADIASSVRK
jgi:hypothetical protein